MLSREGTPFKGLKSIMAKILFSRSNKNRYSPVAGYPWGAEHWHSNSYWVSNKNKIKSRWVGESQLISFNWLHIPGGNPFLLATKSMCSVNFPWSQWGAYHGAQRLMMPWHQVARVSERETTQCSRWRHPLGPGLICKGLPNTSNKWVCSTTCLTPWVCAVDFVPSYPYPQGVVAGGKWYHPGRVCFFRAGWSYDKKNKLSIIYQGST